MLPPAATDCFDSAAINAFLARCLPDPLSEAHRHLGNAFSDVVRVGAFLLDGGSATLSHWADSNGCILPCPTGIGSLPGNPALSRCGASGRAQIAFIRTDPALEWASDGDTCPLLILPLRRKQHFFGFLVIESAPSIALPARIALELFAWGPLAAGLVAHGLESAHELLAPLRFAHTLSLMHDEETGRHQIRLRAYIRILAGELAAAHGLPARLTDEIALFGPLHDIGKISIDDSILLKPAPLDQPEWEQMKTHVIKGRRLIERLADDFALHETPGIETLRAVVSWHHEYLDGSGYPDGRYGDAIPLATRIVTVADIFDALTSPRPYRPASTPETVFNELKSLARDRLDRECVAAFSAARKRVAAAWQGLHAAGR